MQIFSCGEHLSSESMLKHNYIFKVIKWKILFSKGPYNLLTFSDNTNYYSQIGFADFF